MSSAFLGRSSASDRTTRPAIARAPAGKPKSFRAIASRVLNLVYTYALFAYRKLRSALWIGSTGFIFLMIPIMYSKIIETEMEFMRLERASDLAAGKALPGPGGAYQRSF